MSGVFFARSHRSHARARLAGAALLVALLSLVGLFRLSPAAHASSAGPVAFVQTTTTANTSGDSTLINNSVTNGNPSAVIQVTPNWNPFGDPNVNFDTHLVGVWYNFLAGEWGIFNEDDTAMPIGASFNVYATPLPTPGVAFVDTVSGSSYMTLINSPELNGNPSASVQATQNWNPGDGGGVYNPNAIGVWYDRLAGEWAIYNEDKDTLPTGASFNVLVGGPASGMTDLVTQVATSSNTNGDSTCLSGYTNPDDLLFVTHDYSGYFTDPIGVWYDAFLGENCVFDGTYAAMPLGATFFVDIAPPPPA